SIIIKTIANIMILFIAPSFRKLLNSRLFITNLLLLIPLLFHLLKNDKNSLLGEMTRIIKM
ncbi:MAG: hypothetical protein NTW12_11335, partial [Deltaproteobacteria bacterium]|nr:hypothetical protein [Deltaproteobacteria bacterium]